MVGEIIKKNKSRLSPVCLCSICISNKEWPVLTNANISSCKATPSACQLKYTAVQSNYFVWANQRIYFENANTCSNCTLKICVAMQLYLQ